MTPPHPARDPRYDLLFEPVPIGPVVARNRFFQVPHCNGMGHRYPKAMAGMRGVKAEGGWAVVSTEEVEVDWHSDISPYIEGRLWDDRDIGYHAAMVEAVHAHGALAAIEPVHQGLACSNLYSREHVLSPSGGPILQYHPIASRAMDLADIRAARRRHRDVALRAKRAGYDIVYVYAGHDLSLAMHFLLPRYNQRSDDYGGSLGNRLRFLRELLEDTRDAVGDACAVALRIAVDELRGPDGLSSAGEMRDVVGLLAELPDLWDVNISDWANDSQTARFAEEGYQEPFIGFVKAMTSKPVVGVGRYTSPDRMVSLVRKGVLDFVGAARPSIADPFLPWKIEHGRIEDIRECIGCNICVSGDMTMSPIRCTQNPTMAEEWRKGWHPERIAPAASDDPVLVVGAGPAGLECARALGQRGYPVVLAEATDTLGGRSKREALLPGLASYGRVADWRIGQLQAMPNVEIYRASELSADDVLGYGFPHIVIATGSAWRRDGAGRTLRAGVEIDPDVPVFTPDDVMAGRLPTGGRVLLYDDDHYYMGGVVAERLAAAGLQVTLITPDAIVSSWTVHTLEQKRIQRRLLERGVALLTGRKPVRLGRTSQHACVYTGAVAELEADAVVLVTGRAPRDALLRHLQALAGNGAAPWKTLHAIGDVVAPGTVAAAVYSGHNRARLHDSAPQDGVPFEREP
ncbi:MAG: FAD-dependent oxidoreductase [Alphaproteobacteria bacterium]